MMRSEFEVGRNDFSSRDINIRLELQGQKKGSGEKILKWTNFINLFLKATMNWYQDILTSLSFSGFIPFLFFSCFLFGLLTFTHYPICFHKILTIVLYQQFTTPVSTKQTGAQL